MYQGNLVGNFLLGEYHTEDNSKHEIYTSVEYLN